jgi:hypothetical protein
MQHVEMPGKFILPQIAQFTPSAMVRGSEWLFEMTRLGDRWLLEREQFLRRSAIKQGSEKLTDAGFVRQAAWDGLSLTVCKSLKIRWLATLCVA